MSSTAVDVLHYSRCFVPLKYIGVDLSPWLGDIAVGLGEGSLPAGSRGTALVEGLWDERTNKLVI